MSKAEERFLLKQVFGNFLENDKPQRIAKTVRRLLMAYLKGEMNDGFPLDWDEFIQDIDKLFDFLDACPDDGA